MLTLGVLSDTHIPDRTRRLHPQIIPAFKEANVAAILHGGDVSIPSVLRKLGDVAPVYAVRGNRDWLFLRELPLQRYLTFDGVHIVLTHGHGRWWNYLLGRAQFMLDGYRFERYKTRLLATYPEQEVIVFGHTHRPVNLWIDGQLLFNPGSPHFPDEKHYAPSIGLLHIRAGGVVNGEIVNLERMSG